MALPHIAPDIVPRLLPIALLGREQFDRVVLELRQSVSLNLRVEEQVFAIVSKSAGLLEVPKDERLEFAEAIVGLHYLYSAAIWDRTAFLKDLRGSFSTFISQDTGLESTALSESVEPIRSEDFVDEFISRARLVLEIESIRVSVKAYTLMSEHENVFLSSRIFTDLRPVFAEDLELPPPASVILHTIKILTRTDGQQKSFFLVADSDDLLTLRKEIDRALIKRKNLCDRIRQASALGQALDMSDEGGDQ